MAEALLNPDEIQRPGRRYALITGASAGLGAAFARAYAARGCDLALVARRAERLERLADELRGRHSIDVRVVAADLSEEGAAAAVLARAGRPVDILVNNAGFSVPPVYARTDWASQERFIATLVTAPATLAHGVLASMIARGYGRIINVASLAAFTPGVAGHTLYPAAKSFMLRFSQSLDAELRGKGILVTASCPGFTHTEFLFANGTAEKLAQTPRWYWQRAEVVVEAAIRANEAGKVVHIPGWHNKLAACLMRYVPDQLTVPLLRRGAAKYRDEGEGA